MRTATAIPVEVDLELLQPGDPAPEFSVTDQHGNEVSLTGMHGIWAVLWWYPQAMTPGCTSCGKAFRQHLNEFGNLGARVVGLTFSSPEANREFDARLGLGFSLCTAPEDLAAEYGAKRNESESWAGLPRRICYLVDPEGVVAQRYLFTGNAEDHVGEVLADLRARAEVPKPEPDFGPQPHEYGLPRRIAHRVKMRVTGKAST